MQRLFSSCLLVRRMVGRSEALIVFVTSPVPRSVTRLPQDFYSIPLNRGLGDLGIEGLGD